MRCIKWGTFLAFTPHRMKQAWLPCPFMTCRVSRQTDNVSTCSAASSITCENEMHKLQQWLALRCVCVYEC